MLQNIGNILNRKHAIRILPSCNTFNVNASKLDMLFHKDFANGLNTTSK